MTSQIRHIKNKINLRLINAIEATLKTEIHISSEEQLREVVLIQEGKIAIIALMILNGTATGIMFPFYKTKIESFKLQNTWKSGPCFLGFLVITWILNYLAKILFFLYLHLNEAGLFKKLGISKIRAWKLLKKPLNLARNSWTFELFQRSHIELQSISHHFCSASVSFVARRRADISISYPEILLFSAIISSLRLFYSTDQTSNDASSLWLKRRNRNFSRRWRAPTTIIVPLVFS